MPSFTAERRERLLTLLGAGRNVEEACASAGVGRSTVSRWAARGRGPGADADARSFAERFDAIREGRGEDRLSERDVLRLLERAARRGSVAAMKLLLERPWEGREAPAPASEDNEEDPFTALERDELAHRRRGPGPCKAPAGSVGCR